MRLFGLCLALALPLGAALAQPEMPRISHQAAPGGGQTPRRSLASGLREGSDPQNLRSRAAHCTTSIFYARGEKCGIEPDYLAEIVERLDSDKYEVRAAAREELIQLDESRLDDLLKYLSHPSVEVRSSLLEIAATIATTPASKFKVFKTRPEYGALKRHFRAALDSFINHEPLDVETAYEYVIDEETKKLRPSPESGELNEVIEMMCDEEGPPSISSEQLWRDIGDCAGKLAWEAFEAYGWKGERRYEVRRERRLALKRLMECMRRRMEMPELAARARDRGEISFQTFENITVFLNITRVDDNYDFEQRWDRDFWQIYNDADRELLFLILADVFKGDGDCTPPKDRDEALRQVLSGNYLRQMGRYLHENIYYRTYFCGGWTSFGADRYEEVRRGRTGELAEIRLKREAYASEFILYQQRLYEAVYLLDRNLMRLSRPSYDKSEEDGRARPIDEANLPVERWEEPKNWCRVGEALNQQILNRLEKIDARDAALFKAGVATISLGEKGRLSSEALEVSSEDKASIISKAVERAIEFQNALKALETVPDFHRIIAKGV